MFKSVSGSGFRRAFLAFFALSSIVPLLVLVYVLVQYIFPVLSTYHHDEEKNILIWALTAMFLIPLLGFGLMQWWIKYLEALTKQVRHAADSLRESTRTFEVRLGELTAAQRDLKVVATLREKAFGRFRHGVEREEQKQSDEAGVTGFVRDSRGKMRIARALSESGTVDEHAGG